MTTRFILIAGEAGWQITGTYYPCVCNHLLAERRSSRLKMEDGKCNICRGTGTTFTGLGKTPFLWPLRRRRLATGPCKHCGGMGRCPRCAGEDFPGWRNSLRIYGPKETPRGAASRRLEGVARYSANRFRSSP